MQCTRNYDINIDVFRYTGMNICEQGIGNGNQSDEKKSYYIFRKDH